jgi:hypothetical protein
MIFVLGVTLGSTLDTGARALDGSARSGNTKVTNSTARRSGAAQEKGTRTPAQKKIDSQLLYALYRQRGEAESKGVPPGELSVRFDDKGRAIVSIRARVTKTVLAKIKSTGGKIISSFERYHDILAHVRLDKLEALAALKDVYAIMPAQEATTNDSKR